MKIFKLKTLFTLLIIPFILAVHAQAQDTNIAELVESNQSLSTFATAMKVAGFTETLTNDGPFTVFAPTNQAFTKLTEGTLDTLLESETRVQLWSMLTSHLTGGEIVADDFKDGMMIRTAQGIEIEISVDGDIVSLGRATITTKDIRASNGVIHIIDMVIMSPELEADLISSEPDTVVIQNNIDN